MFQQISVISLPDTSTLILANIGVMSSTKRIKLEKVASDRNYFVLLLLSEFLEVLLHKAKQDIYA